MKRFIYILITLWLCGCYGRTAPLNTGHEGKPIPSINLLLMDSTTKINIKTVTSKNPIVLFFFNPNCPYCRHLTKSIIDDITDLAGIDFYMLSDYPFSKIRKYNIDYNLDKYKNIIMAQDYEKFFGSYYKAPAFPCLAIYGKNKMLKQVLIGAVSTNLIKDIAFE